MKNDKKKTLVIGGLALVLVAVGAFQFMPKGKNANTAPSNEVAAAQYQDGADGPSTTASAEGAGQEGGQEGQAADPQKEILLAMVKDPLPRRDPFRAQGVPVQQPAVQQPVTPAQPVNSQRPSGGYRPPRMQGDVAPINPLPSGGLDGAANLTAAAPLRQPGEFAYKVKGVIVGNKPMAVFEDDGGNQRLVPLGGSIDGDSQVVGIERGRVKVRHRGKDKTLTPTEGQ